MLGVKDVSVHKVKEVVERGKKQETARRRRRTFGCCNFELEKPVGLLRQTISEVVRHLQVGAIL